MRLSSAFRSASLHLGLAVCTLGLPACGEGASGVYVEPPPIAVARGSLVLDWSINGYVDPSLCRQSQATTLEVSIDPLDGGPGGTFSKDCEAFATTIGLPVGRYFASALLLDLFGNPRTTAVTIPPFSIYGNDQLRIPIDFPPSSFY